MAHCSGTFLLAATTKRTDWRNSNSFATYRVKRPLQDTKLQLTWLLPWVLPAARDFKVWIFSKTRLTFLLVASSLSVLLEKRQQQAVRGTATGLRICYVPWHADKEPFKKTNCRRYELIKATDKTRIRRVRWMVYFLSNKLFFVTTQFGTGVSHF